MDDVRSPNLDYAADFRIRVLSPYSPWPERKTDYTMIAHGKDQTMVLMLTPDQFYPGTLLMTGGRFWLLLPRSTKPAELSIRQVLQGDISYGDLARANLADSYRAILDGEEKVEGEACHRLELSRVEPAAAFPRIRCWISKRRFHPKTFEYYGETGALLRTARYHDFEKGAIGVRPMRIEVVAAGEKGDRTTLTFSNLRVIDGSAISFSPAGMLAFRDAALASKEASGAKARPEDLVAALTPQKL